MHLKKKKISVILLLLAAAVSVWLAWGNKAIETVVYPVSSGRLPSAFDGFRIAQVSDLHNDEMGKQNEALLDDLRAAAPDLIAVTGDLLDSRVPDEQICLDFLEEAVRIAPVYFVTGNHEGRLYDLYPSFEKQMQQLGVRVLNNEAVPVQRNGEEILIAGFADPNTAQDPGEKRITYLQEWTQSNFTVLLSHRPELFAEYVQGGADAVLTGHAHGGQVRVPFVGGLYAPGQGILPVYDAGRFAEEQTVMIVSRGIGNSLFPLRVNNRPELVILELHTE